MNSVRPAALAAVILLLPALGRAQTYTFSTAATLYGTGKPAVDAAGMVYIPAVNQSTIERLALNGLLTTYAGFRHTAGFTDGPLTIARFHSPRSVALAANGTVYVVDTFAQTIRSISPAGVVTTIAGAPEMRGSTDAPQGTNARFNAPEDIALGAAGGIYVADTGNHTIRQISPSGAVTTLAGSAGSSGAADGMGAAARFNSPRGLAVDSAGNILVVDSNNHAIRHITPAGVVTTIAGSLGNRGMADGPAALARFTLPQSLALDPGGNAFIADSGNYVIRKLSPAGVVTTIGGSPGIGGETSGTGSAARFNYTRGIAVGPAGTLYLADGYSIRVGVPSDQIAIVLPPLSQSVAAGSTASFRVTATGGGPLSYRWNKDGTVIAGATSDTFTIAGVQPSDSGSYAVTVTNPVGTATSSAVTLAVLAALANDHFAGAQVITGPAGQVAGHNNGATGEPGEPTHYVYPATLSSVWYRWTAPENGTVVLDRQSIGFPSAVAVYSGTALAGLTPVTAGNASPISFRVNANATYYIALGSSLDGARGNFTLSWRTLANDAFADAQVLPTNAGQVTGTNIGATREPNEPTHWTGSGGRSVWYRWTPSQSGLAVFDTIGSGFETVLAAYSGAAINALVKHADDYNSYPADTYAPGRSSRILFPVTAGTTYHVVVDSANFSSGTVVLNWQITLQPVIRRQPLAIISVPGGTSTVRAPMVAPGTHFTLSVRTASFLPASIQWFQNGVPVAGATGEDFVLVNIQPANAGTYHAVVANASGAVSTTVITVVVLIPPPNDNFAAAESLTGLTGSVAGTNVNATGEPGEPPHWSLAGAATSIWYRWTAPTSGLAVLDTVGSRFDTVLAVYTGSSLGSLARLTQDDDRGGGRTSQVSFAVTSGTTYYIAVGGGTASARGAVTLNWNLSPRLAITTAPVHQTVAAGGSTTFSVQATGIGVTYQWNRNGVPIPSATNATLTIGNIQGGADAAFTVTVSNASGSVTSEPAILTVAAPSITTLSLRHQRPGADLLWSIAGGTGQLVTVGSFGVILSSSDHGTTWVPRASGTTGWLVAVTYGGGQFVAVGQDGYIATSPDGAVWTRVASSGTTERLNNILHADGKYVAVGEHGTVVTSVDGRVWTLRTTPVNTWLHGLAYNPRIRQFATSGQGGVFMYSPDAVTWTLLPVPGVKSALQHTVAVDSYASFVSVGENGLVVGVRRNELVLKDGEPLVVWTAEARPTSTTSNLVGLVQAAGALFATSVDGKVITATSDRGPWYTLPSGTNGYLLAGTYYDNQLYIVGQQEAIIQSDPLYTSRLINISTRGQVGRGENILISGFVVSGTARKQVLIRAAGPALAPFGVAGTIAAPVLTLHNAAGSPLEVNGGWSNATNASAIAAAAARVGAFPFPAASADAALLVTLDPGAYTAQISGRDGTTGVSIVEVYDADPMSNDGSRTINISTRGEVGAGQNRMFAGFIIEGASARRVLIRAVGPGLASAPFHLTGTVGEPQIELYNSRGLLQATAGAWGLESNADEIRGATKAVGGFELADGSKDSAMLMTLLPGAWTVQVSGANNTTGIAIVEVYAVP